MRKEWKAVWEGGGNARVDAAHAQAAEGNNWMGPDWPGSPSLGNHTGQGWPGGLGWTGSGAWEGTRAVWEALSTGDVASDFFFFLSFLPVASGGWLASNCWLVLPVGVEPQSGQLKFTYYSGR